MSAPLRARQPRMNLDEFLVWDDGTDTRYELVDGTVWAMAPAHAGRGKIANNIGRRIGDRLKAPCAVIHEGGVKLPNKADTYYVSDLAISCNQDFGQVWVTDPVVLIEIHGPGASRKPDAPKMADYLRVPSVQEVLLVEADSRVVMRHRRRGESWETTILSGEASLELTSIGVAMTLAEVFEGIG